MLTVLNWTNIKEREPPVNEHVMAGYAGHQVYTDYITEGYLEQLRKQDNYYYY